MGIEFMRTKRANNGLSILDEKWDAAIRDSVYCQRESVFVVPCVCVCVFASDASRALCAYFKAIRLPARERGIDCVHYFSLVDRAGEKGSVIIGHNLDVRSACRSRHPAAARPISSQHETVSGANIHAPRDATAGRACPDRRRPPARMTSGHRREHGPDVWLARRSRHPTAARDAVTWDGVRGPYAQRATPQSAVHRHGQPSPCQHRGSVRCLCKAKGATGARAGAQSHLRRALAGADSADPFWARFCGRVDLRRRQVVRARRPRAPSAHCCGGFFFALEIIGHAPGETVKGGGRGGKGRRC
eukprot:scaffold6770_cov125-Isochrysis_galbana.AAC.2